MIKIIDLQKKSWQWITLLTLAFIWGSSFILMKKGLHSYSNTQVAAFRLFFSFLLLSPFIVMRIRQLKKHHVRSIIIVGFLGNGIPAFLFTTAQTHISSSLSGMLNSLTPFFTLIVGLWFFKSKALWHNIIGVLLGLVGALGLIVRDMNDVINSFNMYAGLVAIATLCYGISANQTKAYLTDLNGISISAFSYMITGLLAGVYLFFSDFSAAMQTPDHWENLGYVFLLATFGSVIAMILFNSLIKYTTSIFVTSVTYIIPVFAIMWGIIDGETVSAQQLLFITVVMLGVYLVNKKTPIFSDEQIAASPYRNRTLAFLHLLVTSPIRRLQKNKVE